MLTVLLVAGLADCQSIGLTSEKNSCPIEISPQDWSLLLYQKNVHILARRVQYYDVSVAAQLRQMSELL